MLVGAGSGARYRAVLPALYLEAFSQESQIQLSFQAGEQ